MTVNINTSDALHVPQLWEAVADKLRAAILDGSLPAGTKLVESELAERSARAEGRYARRYASSLGKGSWRSCSAAEPSCRP